MQNFVSLRYFRLVVVFVMRVGITLVLMGLVLEGDKLRQVMSAWRDAGPHTTLLGKMQGHLVAASWLASPRVPECGFTLERERRALPGEAVQEGEAGTQEFVFRFVCAVCVAVVVVVVFVALVAGCSWARQTLARHHRPREKGSETVPLPAPGVTEEAASEARGRGQQDEPPLQDTAASQEVKHTEVEDVLEEAGEQVLSQQETDPVRDQNLGRRTSQPTQERARRPTV
ncbi:hypothetical protein GWK47_034373 [Chionoecetes opilio]|uniref:Uncharacterized protein n=1 Tax=Chionoecetes opilio TaxID=41210 RepID=A0A8J4YP29_CHIOP|nr:hypothetical protein GWK47_034373 [Chionoecetes opilio]